MTDRQEKENAVFDKLKEKAAAEPRARLNILVPPDVRDKLKLIAASQGISMNEYANRIFLASIAEFVDSEYKDQTNAGE